MRIHAVLKEIGLDAAKEYAAKYFSDSTDFPGAHQYTGADFETLAAEQNDPFRITAGDILAVQTLSVTVPARAVIEILERYNVTITTLLQRIPVDRTLQSLDEDEFDQYLDSNSPALQLWDLLRRNNKGDERWDVGRTIASKILARKRPHLVPIEDDIVNTLIGIDHRDSWREWWMALRADSELERTAAAVRDHVGRPYLSTPRALDIVLWMHGKKGRRIASAGD